MTGTAAIDGILAISAIAALLAISLRANKLKIVSAIVGAASIAISYFVSTENVHYYFAIPMWLAYTLISFSPSISSRLFSSYNNVKKALAVGAFVAGFEALAVVGWVVYPFLPDSTNPFWNPLTLESQFYFFISLSAPVMILVLISTIVLRITGKGFLSKVTTKLQSWLPSGNLLVPTKIFWGLIASLIILSLVLPLYPNSPRLNPGGTLLGTDDIYYYDWLGAMSESDDSIRFAFTDIRGGDRPLTLLVMYGIIKVTGVEIESLLLNFRAVIAPLFTAIVALFVHRLTRDRLYVLVASFMAATSFQVAVGIYAGFYANWLALLPTMTSFFLVVEYYRTKKIVFLPLILLSMSVAMLFHVYTWVFCVAAVLVFISISVLKRRKDLAILLPVIIVVGVSITIDLLRSEGLSLTGGIAEDTNLIGNYVGQDQFIARWTNLTYLFRAFMGGLFSNVSIIVLSTVWVLRAKLDNVVDRMLLSITIPFMIPMLLSDYGVQSRLLYDTPIFLLAAIVIADIIRRRQSHYYLLALSLMLFQCTYILRALANLYLQLPS